MKLHPGHGVALLLTTTFYSSPPSSSSPSDHHQRHQHPNNSPRLTFFVTEIREFHCTRSLHSPTVFDRSIETSSSSSSSDDVVSLVSYYSATSTSVKALICERTMDIMSIVGAILFGVGCGALTAAASVAQAHPTQH